MLSAFQDLRNCFEISLKDILKEHNKKEEYGKIRKNIIVPSTKDEFGDYQSNVSLILSKVLKKNPRDIAYKFINSLEKNDNFRSLCENIEIAGPGFINIKLKKVIFTNKLISNLNSPNLGIPLSSEKNKKIIVDFSSPNIAKEMHVGHLRSTIIGDTIARILELRGYEVLRINHVGDWGTQFGMLIAHLKDVYPESINDFKNIDLGDLVNFYKASKKRFDNESDFQNRARLEVVKLQNGEENSLKAWRILCDESRKEFNNIYKILNIKIIERGESFYNQYLENIIEELNKKCLLVEDDGAKCVFLDGISNKEGSSLPLIVQKKDGGFNYATTDLAALRYRFNKPPKGDGAGRIIYVTDQGQSNHFEGIFQVAKKASWIPENCNVDHVPFGLVQGIDGKKLKTREGKTIRLKDLLSESIKRAKLDLENRINIEKRNEDEEFINHASKVIGISSVKYADLSQNRITNYQFSFEKMLALNGNTAPYLLYTVVRISGINRKNNDAHIFSENINISFSDDLEWKLLKKLLKLDEIIISIEKDLLPNRLCTYLFELCQIFNRFYDKLPILKAEKEEMFSRLKLCALTEKTLKLSLGVLGIETLERM